MLETLFELSLIPVPIDPHVHAIPIGLPEFPLPNVVVALGSKPHPRAMLQSAQPLPLIMLPIGPLMLADSLGLAIHVVPLIYAAILHFLIPLSVLII